MLRALLTALSVCECVCVTQKHKEKGESRWREKKGRGRRRRRDKKKKERETGGGERKEQRRRETDADSRALPLGIFFPLIFAGHWAVCHVFWNSEKHRSRKQNLKFMQLKHSVKGGSINSRIF